MGIWAEIKKAINSNLNLPLNEKIDRDIEENRIGHGFITSTEPKIELSSNSKFTKNSYNFYLNSNLYINHIVSFKGEYYMLGSMSSSYCSTYYKTSSLSSSETTGSGSLPFGLQNGIAFAYNNYLYIMGGSYGGCSESFFKFDGTNWTNVMTLPFSIRKGHAYVYKNKVYIWDYTNRTVRVFDGSNFSEIAIDLDEISSSVVPFGKLFEKDEKLYLVILGVFYRLNEETGNFVKDNSIPSNSITGSNFLPFVSPNGYLYLIVGKTLKVLVGKEWVILGSLIDQFNDSQYVVDGYTVYGGQESTNLVQELVIEPVVATLKFYLPKNTSILFNAEGILDENILPVENCIVEGHGHLKSIKDGQVECRLLYGYSDVDIMFR